MNTTTILQVEDDPNDVFLFQHAMRKVGVTNPIHVASDGQQAIDYLNGAGRFGDRERFPLPCLVLLDLKLPYVMGLDVLKWIREQSGNSRIVVLMTASGQEKDVSAAYRLGANGYLVKPSEANQLEGMARAIKDYWLTYNTPPPDDSSAGKTSDQTSGSRSIKDTSGGKKNIAAFLSLAGEEIRQAA